MGSTETIGNPVEELGEIFGTSLVATVLFIMAHFVLRPAPVPALVGLAGGLLGFWIDARGRFSAMAVGWVAGTLMGMGMGIHLYSHYSEGRLGESAEGMVPHLLLDAARGISVSLPILALSLWVILRWSKEES